MVNIFFLVFFFRFVFLTCFKHVCLNIVICDLYILVYMFTLAGFGPRIYTSNVENINIFLRTSLEGERMGGVGGYEN